MEKFYPPGKCKRRKFTPKEWKMLEGYLDLSQQSLSHMTTFIGCSTIPVKFIDECLKIEKRLQFLRWDLGVVLAKENPSVRGEALDDFQVFRGTRFTREQLYQIDDEVNEICNKLN